TSIMLRSRRKHWPLVQPAACLLALLAVQSVGAADDVVLWKFGDGQLRHSPLAFACVGNATVTTIVSTMNTTSFEQQFNQSGVFIVPQGVMQITVVAID